MKYLTPKEVRQELNVSVSLVYKEIRSGNLLSHRFGKRAYRISEVDLQRYVAERSSANDGQVDAQPVERGNSPSQFKHLDVSQLLSSQK